MASINPYLNFNGTTEAAFNFYKSVFGGEFTTFQRFKDVPSEVPSPQGEGEKIMHVALPISKETLLMGSDVPSTYPQAIMGTNFSISVNVESEAEAKKIFNGLSAGGKITMPLDKMFWGAYFGMLTDKFGIQWMVNYQLK
jgi:PhnB protein